MLKTEIKNINNPQKTKHKVRTFDLIFALLVTAVGALFFLCITRSIEGISLFNPWISGMMCAMIFEMLLSLFAVTVGVKKLIVPIVIIAFLPSIIFTPVVWHMFIVVVAILMTIKGLYMMRQALFNMLKIDIVIIIRSGIAYVGFALVIVIISQYYFFIKNNTETIFDASNYVGASNMVIDHLLKKGNVENISINTMTVDEFLQFLIDNVYTQEEVQSPQFSDENEGMLLRWAGQAGITVDSIEKQVNNQALEQMRTNVSEMIGRDIGGGEMITDVFAEIISTQIDRAMMNNSFLRENKVIIFTVIFAIIVLSLMPIVRIFSGFCVRFVFMLLREFKIVRVTKTKRDAEVISF